MYKVMLVDDDYPVLEFISEAINWGKLGVTLQSTHENGSSAFEKALDEMPDILITDIGMPKMNGIELTKRLKELNPDIQVIILSCHSEFKFAKQALKLQVKDYLVKDTFDPEDLYEVLTRAIQSLDSQKQKNLKQLQIQQLLEKNKDSLRERFIRQTFHQPQIPEDEWLKDAKTLGLELDSKRYTAALAFIHDFHKIKGEFSSEDYLTFGINHIIEDILKESKLDAVHFCLGAKLMILFPYSHTIKMDPFDKVYGGIIKIQNTLKHDLKIHLSFLIGKEVSNLEEFRQELSLLVSAKQQSFYMQPGSVVMRDDAQPVKEDLFSKCDEASADFRELLLMKDDTKIVPIVSKWITFIEEREFPPEVVKEWMLKILLDLKVKLHALQFFKQEHSIESVHQQILRCDFLSELRELLIDYFKLLLSLSNKVYQQTKHREILDAISYVTKNLEKRISLEEVAGYLFLNQSYFSRLFKKEMGETFIEYVTKMKVTRAKELLEQTTESVGKICERLGYDNQSYFIKLFKTHVGVTPNEYRSGKVSAC